MTSWTVGQLLEAIGGELVTGDRMTPVSGVSLDSRRLAPEEAFVAIRGHRFDAHDFLPEAIARGAACLIVARLPEPLPSVATILVPDTVRALGAIASFHRARCPIPVIAVTGSCGKTTTKELIAHLLQASRRVLKTQGTENNHIGLPLTLLKLTASHEVAVVELGSNHPGEIAYLANIARPTVAVITNVGPAHLEFFGSLDGVRREKVSLVEALGPGGWAIVPGDQLDVLLEAKSRLAPGARLMTFGTSTQCGIQADDIRREDRGLSMRVRDVPGRFALPLLGLHNLENALAALACMKVLGIPLESVQEHLRRLAPLPWRSQLIQANGITIVNDCYNANPLSFARALEIFRDLSVRRKVLIAGDMLELGEDAPLAHQTIGRLAMQVGVDVVVAVGSFAAEVAKGAATRDHITPMTCRTVEELQGLLPTILQAGDGLLIKGSRKMQLERVTDFLLQHYGYTEETRKR
jgi:UDP-N-acetylmuramoyl-tripeptide--D-alanyl-D-alanine ligase